MKRREFIGLLGGAAAGWPLRAGAQGAGKVFRLGALSPATAQFDSIRGIVLPELAKAGIVEGRNLILDLRAGSMEKLPQLAPELIAANPDAIMAVSGAAIGALKAASSTVPIVMSFSDYDPVAAGFAASFARPGGNITGIAMLATVLDAKRLDLLHEAVPAAHRIAVLLVSESRHESTLAAMRVAASANRNRACPGLRGASGVVSAGLHSDAHGRCTGARDRGGTRVQSRCRNSRCFSHRGRAADDVRVGTHGCARLLARLRSGRA